MLATTASTEASRTSAVSAAITAWTIRRVRRCCRTSSPSISSLGTSRMAAASVAIWSPEPGVAQGKTRITPGPGHIQILGLGLENTAERGVTSGGGRAEITAVVVPDPGAISNDDQQMIRALAGNP